MRSKYLVVLSTLALLIAACNKNTGLVYTGDKVATKNDCINGITYTYTYNSDGLVASIAESTGDKTLYSYIGDTVLIQIYNSANILTSGYTYWLNSKDLADTAKGMLLDQNHSYSYSYNSDYRLLQMKSYAYGNLKTIDNYNIVSKNISYVEHINIDNNTRIIDRYDYYPSNGNTLGNQSMGQSFLGVQTANLIRTNSKVDNNGDTTDVITYRYHFDGSSRADTVATYNRAGQRIDSVIYTYY